MKYFVPFRDVVTDKSVVHLASNCHPSVTGMDSESVLCNCETRYVQDIILYTASDLDIPYKDTDPHGFSGVVVKELLYLKAAYEKIISVLR